MKPEQRERLLSLKLENGRTVEEELRGMRGFSELLDTKFEILGFKFGLDAVIGLIPVAGDGVTLVAGFFAVSTAIRLGLPPGVIASLIIRLLIDAGIGSIPVLGDLFDFFFRSHKRNFQAIETALLRQAERKAKASARSLVSR